MLGFSKKEDGIGKEDEVFNINSYRWLFISSL